MIVTELTDIMTSAYRKRKFQNTYFLQRVMFWNFVKTMVIISKYKVKYNQEEDFFLYPVKKTVSVHVVGTHLNTGITGCVSIKLPAEEKNGTGSGA